MCQDCHKNGLTVIVHYYICYETIDLNNYCTLGIKLIKYKQL